MKMSIPGVDPVWLEGLDATHLHSVFAVLQSQGPHISVSYIKSIFHAWTTSARVRQSITVFGHRPHRGHCIFGCEGPDCWAHYVCCIPLWSAIADVLPSFELSPRPEVLLGLVGCTPCQVQGVCLGYHVYHALCNCGTIPQQRLEATVIGCYSSVIAPMLSRSS
eukprot:6894196-Karenia_brevis.AAC.1